MGLGDLGWVGEDRNLRFCRTSFWSILDSKFLYSLIREAVKLGLADCGWVGGARNLRFRGTNFWSILESKFLYCLIREAAKLGWGNFGGQGKLEICDSQEQFFEAF